MTSPSFVVHYLFFILLISYSFDLTSGRTTPEPMDSSEETVKTSTTRSKKTVQYKTTTTPSKETTAGDYAAEDETSTASETTTTTVPKVERTQNTTSTSLKVMGTSATNARITNTSDRTLVTELTSKHNFTSKNRIIRIERPKSSLPIVLGSIFGGLAIIVLVTSILLYIFIKRGYIKIFNQPRTRGKDTDRSRIADSSTSIGVASPSRR